MFIRVYFLNIHRAKVATVEETPNYATKKKKQWPIAKVYETEILYGDCLRSLEQFYQTSLNYSAI